MWLDSGSEFRIRTPQLDYRVGTAAASNGKVMKYMYIGNWTTRYGHRAGAVSLWLTGNDSLHAKNRQFIIIPCKIKNDILGTSYHTVCLRTRSSTLASVQSDNR